MNGESVLRLMLDNTFGCIAVEGSDVTFDFDQTDKNSWGYKLSLGYILSNQWKIHKLNGKQVYTYKDLSNLPACMITDIWTKQKIKYEPKNTVIIAGTFHLFVKDKLTPEKKTDSIYPPLTTAQQREKQNPVTTNQTKDLK